jgi:hypothetical protein
MNTDGDLPRYTSLKETIMLAIFTDGLAVIISHCWWW